MKKFMLVVLLCAAAGLLHGQTNDTLLLRLTLADAKSLLLKENLELMAAQYDLSNAEADVIQAGLWNNPNFVFNADLYSVERNEYFNYRNQKLIQLEHMVPFTGRHRKARKVAEVGLEMAKAEYENTIRELLYNFTQTFYELHASYKASLIYVQADAVYDKSIAAAQKQYETGLIAGSEVVRLKSERLALHNDRVNNSVELQNLMANMRMLLNLKPGVTIEPIVNDSNTNTAINLADLTADAANNRPDYESRLLSIKYNQKNLTLQKALAIADSKVGFQPHDKGSNYVRPYTGLVLEFYLPVFNRNQGEIQKAKNSIKQSQLMVLQKENEIMNEVVAAYQSYQLLDNAIKLYSADFFEQINELNKNANENYTRKTISILEYIDFQRIYLQTSFDFISLQKDYFNSKAQLNYVTGKEIF